MSRCKMTPQMLLFACVNEASAGILSICMQHIHGSKMFSNQL